MAESHDKPPPEDTTPQTSLIVTNPEYYFAAQSKTLAARIADCDLSDSQIKDIQQGKGKKLIRDTILGTFTIGKIAKVVIDWNERVDKEIKEAKKTQLIESYFNVTDDNERAISHLKSLVCDPTGSFLFNKILSIIDDNPPDKEQFEHLAAALKYIAESDFARLFGEHKYAISQIGQMTPQALSILADNANWPPIKLGSSTTHGSKVASDYNDEFAIAFAKVKKITDADSIERLKHSISELITRRFIEAHKHSDGEVRCAAVGVGKSLLPYLSNSFA